MFVLSTSKRAAEQSWEQQMAEAAGIELSDGEGDEEEDGAEKEAKTASSRALQQVRCIPYMPIAQGSPVHGVISPVRLIDF